MTDSINAYGLPGLRRRSVLKGMAGLAGTALLPAAAGRAFAADSIIFWDYKGEPGSMVNTYYLAAAERFKAASGIDVKVEYKSAAIIEQSVAAAANAGTGVDSMCWWSGPTVRNQASLGNVIPLDDKIPAETLDNKVGMTSLTYEGRTYAFPRTIGPYFFIYNRELLKKAGVDPDVFPAADQDPVEWSVFLDACDKVKASGVAPLMFANKEGYHNEWYFYNFIGMGFDTIEEIAEIGSGKSTWKNEAIYQALAAYKELYDRKYFVEGGEVIPLEQDAVQMARGQAAMSVYYNQAGGASAAIADTFGAGSLGFSRVPAYRRDKPFFNHTTMEPDAVFVTAFSSNEEAAVKWVNFLASVGEVNEMTKATQLAPADKRFDQSLIDSPELRKLYKGATEKGYVYPGTLATSAQYNALLQNGILYLTGKWSAEQLCDSFDKADKEYLDSL